MNPVVGLGLTHRKLQRMHRLQWVSLLIDQNKQKLLFHALQHSFGATAYAALPGFACTRQLVRIPLCVGLLKRGQ